MSSQHDDCTSGEVKEKTKTTQIHQVIAQIHVNLLEVGFCDEKEIIISCQIYPNVEHLTSLWESVQQKLRLRLKGSPNDNEWFDQYSIYTKNLSLSPTHEQKDIVTDGTSSKLRLIKTVNDFIHHFEQCIMNEANEEGGQVSINIEIKPKCWDDEYKYINNCVLEKRKEYASKDKKIESSDECIDFLIEHFAMRLKILDNIQTANSCDKRKIQPINTTLSKEEKNAMEYLFGNLIKLAKMECVNDDTIKYIQSAQKAAIRDEKWEKVLLQLRKAISKMRMFDIRLFLKHYKEHEIACESLDNENVVLFIGSTGAGKSTTIYFLNGVEMERDKHDNDHIRAKKGAKVAQELSNIKLQQSIRTSVTTHITAVPVMLKKILSNDGDNDDAKSNSNDNDSISNKVVFCDTPGFGDSRGIEIDISNSFGLINAMKSAKSVRVIFVISKEDMAHKVERLKILANSLFHYLAHYKSSISSNTSKSELETKVADEDYSDESSCESDSDNSESRLDAFDNDLLVADENFCAKLKDIGIIFTKFANVKSIKKSFSNEEMRKLEAESRKHKNAFYYLNKHINTLVNNDKIVLIDPINGNYKVALNDIFVTNSPKWIQVTDENFQAYTSPDKMCVIQDQVMRDCNYVNNLIDSNSNIMYGRVNGDIDGIFDYFGLIEKKINRLSELDEILGNQCSNMIQWQLTICIDKITQHWNSICTAVQEKTTGFASNGSQTNLTMYDASIREYESRIGDFLQILNRLLVRYDGFRTAYLPDAMSNHQLRDALGGELMSLLNDCKFEFKCNTSDDDTNNHQRDPEENIQVEFPENKQNEIASDRNVKAGISEKSIDDRRNSLLRCLIILKYFGNSWDEYFNDYLKQIYDQCVTYINENKFKHVVSVVGLLDGTIRKINSADIEMKSLQDNAQWKHINRVSMQIKQELKLYLDLQLKNIRTVIKNMTDVINFSDNQTSWNDLRQAYDTICKSKAELPEYFIGTSEINPKILMDNVHDVLHDFRRSMESKVDGIVDNLNDDEYKSDLDCIQQLVSTISSVMSISNNFMPVSDAERVIDNILARIVMWLNNLSNKYSLEMIINEMRWMVKYHSNKQNLGNLFESTIVESKMKQLNDSLTKNNGLNLAQIKASPQHVKNIVHEIIDVGRSLYHGCNLFYGICSTNRKKVNTWVGSSITVVQKKIKQVFEDTIGIKLSEVDGSDVKMPETDNNDHHFDEIHINDEQASDCAELFDICKRLDEKNSDGHDDKNAYEFVVNVQLLTKTTIKTVEEYFKNYGMLQCRDVTNALKYFETLTISSIGHGEISELDNCANGVELFRSIESNLNKYKALSKYLYAGYNMNEVVAQWRQSISLFYDKINETIPSGENPSIFIAHASVMIICKALTVVDDCGILEENRRFSSLVDKIESLIDSDCKELTKVIEEQNFPSISQQFEKQQQQLKVSGKYDYARKYLVNKMFAIIKQLINIIEILPTIKMDKYFETKQTFGQLTEKIQQIITLKLVKYIDDENKNKWNENLQQIFVRARSSANAIISLSLRDVEESRYDELQSKIEILKDFESKLMILKAYQDVQDYESSENEVKQVIDKVQQQLDQDCVKFSSLNIEQYDSQSQPSTISKILSTATNVSGRFDSGSIGKKLGLIECYTKALKKIESSFTNVFEAECKDLMKIESNFYQYSARVDRCCKLVDSLMVGNLKFEVSPKLEKMKVKFNKLRKDEDDKIVKQVQGDSKSIIDRMRRAKSAVFGDSTQQSKLSDFKAVYEEYLKRIEHHDPVMVTKLQKIMLNKVSEECEEIETCVRSEKLFDTKVKSMNRFHARINELKSIINSILSDDRCGQEFVSNVENAIVEMCKTNKRDIATCQNAVQREFKNIETMQKQWFAVDEFNSVQQKHVTKLATHILRLMNGLVHYRTILVDILPSKHDKLGVYGIVTEIGDLLKYYFDQWTKTVEQIVIENSFEKSIPYLETVTIFQNNAAMKQIRSSIGGEIVRQFSCSNISIMVKKHLKTKKEEILDTKNGLAIVNGGDVSQSMKMRIEQYQQLKKNLTSLRLSRQIDKYLDISTDSELYKPCFSYISDEIKTATQTIANKFKEKLNEESLIIINHLFSNLDALATVGIFDYFYSLENQRLRVNVGKLELKIFSKLQDIGKEASNKNSTLEKIRECMITLKIAQHSLINNQFQAMITTWMEKAMVVQKKKHGILALSQLFINRNSNVKSNEAYWCAQILSSFPIFSGAVTHSLNTKFGEHAKDIDAALENMLVGKTGNVDNKDKMILKEMYQSFDKQYWDLVKKYIINHKEKAQGKIKAHLKQKQIILRLRERIEHVMVKHDNNYGYSDRIIELMAHIFCVWTVLDAAYFFEIQKRSSDKKLQAKYNMNTKSNVQDEMNASLLLNYNLGDLYDIGDCETYLRQPKVTQIVAIILLFGLNQIHNTNKNHDKVVQSNLVEIKTGEGKSLVLAISACIIAFLGFNVYCTCYRKLLTQRDYREFIDLFTQLNIAHKISYGMYANITKKWIPQEFYTGTEHTLSQFISKTSKYNRQDFVSTSTKKQVLNETWDAKNTVLLVDEVDVFFDERYFGKNHRIHTKLQHDCISKLLDEVWSLYKNGRLFATKKDDTQDAIMKVRAMNVEMVKNQPVYQDCQEIFGFWMPVIDRAIKRMIEGVQRFNKHRYIVHNNCIGYYKEDNRKISYSITYGYKTVFAYFKEHERNKISQKALEMEKVIHLIYGSISYAELPLEFMSIAGVTGTLSQLEESRKDILMNKYNIDKFTYIPTMFKQNKLTFDEKSDVHLVDDSKWYTKICEEMVKQMGRTKQRPILIFFQTNEELKLFYKRHRKREKESCQWAILNERLEFTEKIKVIKNACRLNTITLCTRIFGRGTNFVVIDDRVNELGGPHVIQTFFSSDLSEEIQIKGRTARNGGNGSFSMILNTHKLWSKFGNEPLTYKTLNEKRQLIREQLNREALKRVDSSKILHEQTKQLMQHLKTENKNEVLKLLMTITSY